MEEEEKLDWDCTARRATRYGRNKSFAVVKEVNEGFAVMESLSLKQIEGMCCKHRLYPSNGILSNSGANRSQSNAPSTRRHHKTPVGTRCCSLWGCAEAKILIDTNYVAGTLEFDIATSRGNNIIKEAQSAKAYIVCETMRSVQLS